jgi:hypothetical protein
MKGQRLLMKVLLMLMLGVSLILGACGKKLPPPDSNNPIARIAVLPLRNNTDHLYAPDWIRQAFNDAVPRRYYSAMPLSSVDQQLKVKIGLSLGAQLDIDNPTPVTPTPQQIGAALGVDGLFYGSLDAYSNFVTGIYNKYKIKVRFKLVNAKTGAVVWERVVEQADSETNVSPMAALKSAKGKVMEVAADHVKEIPRENPLPEPTAKLIEKLVSSPIPSGPVGARK